MRKKLSRSSLVLSVLALSVGASENLDSKESLNHVYQVDSVEETVRMAGEFEASAVIVMPEPLLTKYVCAHGEKMRRVEIKYRAENIAVPCSVNYTRDIEEPDQVTILWTAKSQAGFCEEKATAFVAKQQACGWRCEEI